MYMKFSEILLCIPTNTAKRKCLALKIRTQVNYSEIYEVDSIFIYKKLPFPVNIEELYAEENKIEGAEQQQETN